MSRNVRYALIILIAILLFLASGFFFKGGELEVTESGQRTSALTKVAVTSSDAQIFQPILKFNARTEAFREGTVRTQTSGPIISIELDEGATVSEGDILVSLGIEDRELRVREFKALLTQTELEYQAAASLQKKGLLSDADVARNQSLLDSAQASVDAAELELERVKIKAPFNGFINERFVELGDFVQRGDAIAEILQLNPIKAVFGVSESEIVALDTQAPVRLALSDGRILEGEFLFRSAKADQNNRTFRIEVVFQNPTEEILADLTGVVAVQRQEVYAHSLPASLLSLNTDGVLVVKTLSENDLVASYPVDIVSDQLDKVWVTGLPDQANVITRGYEYVGVGEQVAPSYDEANVE